MDKKKTIILLSIIIFIFIAYLVIPAKKISITVKNGEGASSVAFSLKQEKLISSKNFFVLVSKITGASSKIKAGAYEFSKKDNTFTILRKLKKGTSTLVKITIPEGSNIKQTAEILSKKIKIDRDKFIKIAVDKKMEGYLMPETYMFDPAMNEEEIINMMKREFDKKVTSEMQKRAKEINMPMEKVIILASIIEKEAVKPEERSIISAVFHNRLKKRMRLESCATVLYAMGKNKPRLSIEDTKFESPYNTYTNFGLPPAPICSPGIESIKAALYPADTNSLFFVARGDGGHLFSSTLEGHNRNKQITRNR